MTVFKGYMKIIGQNRMLILLYVAIFFRMYASVSVHSGKDRNKLSGGKVEYWNCR